MRPTSLPSPRPSHAPAGDPSRAQEAAQYLTFMLGDETFAIGILAIKEIIEYRSLTEVPMMPSAVRGVINLRGAVVPVVDLQTRFGRSPSGVGRRTCIVIVEVPDDDPAQAQTVGIVVDAVNEVLDIDAAQIEPPPSFGARIRTEFMQGMGKVGGRFVILLDVPALLSGDIAGLSAVAEAANESGALADRH